MKRKQRKEIKLVGDKAYYLRTFLTILCLVGLTGMSVTLINISLIAKHVIGSDPMLLRRIVLASSLTVAVILCCSFLVAFFYTKKVGGPLHGLELKLRRMMEENTYIPIKFRKNDEFKSLGDTLDEFARKFIK